MARWEQYRASRTSWGINVLGSFCIEIEASDGTKGFATGFGGPPACWLVHQHFERFLIGNGKDGLTQPMVKQNWLTTIITTDPRDINDMFEKMYRRSMFYSRKGLPIAVISVIDLAL